jgi:hypothetical protein
LINTGESGFFAKKSMQKPFHKQNVKGEQARFPKKKRDQLFRRVQVRAPLSSAL